ncbi:MAG: hypothetical protein AB7T37_16630 [Dehalococcoidia bacterium]
MPLFSRKKPDPVEHPAVVRTIYVRAAASAVIPLLEAYSALTPPKRAAEQVLSVGEGGGWTAVRLPEHVHPWQLHNLAVWLLDVPGVEQQVVVESAAGPSYPGYWLIPDPRVGEWLCGRDDAGNGWTVNVPNNEIARPDAVPVGAAPAVPPEFASWRAVNVRLEDPGNEMNPGIEATVATRKDLARRQRGVPIDIANI